MVAGRHIELVVDATGSSPRSSALPVIDSQVLNLELEPRQVLRKLAGLEY